MTYRSSKTYGHEVGLSCVFRQWRADSHCALLHGYALSVRLEFEADTLDHRNWVVDFGGLKEVKQWLTDTFDHTMLVARDDPQREHLELLENYGIADITWVDEVGCEAFAELVYRHVSDWVVRNCGSRVRLHHVTVAEHGANAASFMGDN